MHSIIHDTYCYHYNYYCHITIVVNTESSSSTEIMTSSIDTLSSLYTGDSSTVVNIPLGPTITGTPLSTSLHTKNDHSISSPTLPLPTSTIGTTTTLNEVVIEPSLSTQLTLDTSSGGDDHTATTTMYDTHNSTMTSHTYDSPVMTTDNITTSTYLSNEDTTSTSTVVNNEDTNTSTVSINITLMNSNNNISSGSLLVNVTSNSSDETVNSNGGPRSEKSVFLRLSNRINNLELNMSLFGSYLDQISTRYVYCDDNDESFIN